MTITKWPPPILGIKRHFGPDAQGLPTLMSWQRGAFQEARGRGTKARSWWAPQNCGPGYDQVWMLEDPRKSSSSILRSREGWLLAQGHTAHCQNQDPEPRYPGSQPAHRGRRMANWKGLCPSNEKEHRGLARRGQGRAEDGGAQRRTLMSEKVSKVG